MAFLLKAALFPVAVTARAIRGDNVGRAIAEEAAHVATAPLADVVDIIQGKNVFKVLLDPLDRIAKRPKVKVVILDAAPGRGALGAGWDIGSALCNVSHGFTIIRATSWLDAFQQLALLRGVDEVQFWGHGCPGYAFIGRDQLDITSLPRYARLLGPDVLASDALFWLRTCSSFNEDLGRRFAECLLSQLNVGKVAGHTKFIHAVHPGLVVLRRGERAEWGDKTGAWCLGTDLSHHSLE